MGLALAILLTKKGAHVSIVARDKGKLDKAIKDLEVRTCPSFVISLTNHDGQAVRQNQNQILKAHSFSLDSAADSAAALRTVCEVHGGAAPDAVFACAGSSKPMYFVEMSEEDMSQGMTAGYWVQAWTAFVRFACIILVLSFIIGVGSSKANGSRTAQRQDCFCVVDFRVHVFCGLVVVFACQTCPAR